MYEFTIELSLGNNLLVCLELTTDLPEIGITYLSLVNVSVPCGKLCECYSRF